jgi:integral membrane protein
MIPSTPRRLLDVILVVGALDFLLLLVLLYVAWIDRSDAAVSILGPIHGVGFLALLFLTFRGAVERYWGWWFPAIVLVTGGPIGSLIGELVLRRRIRPAAEPV